MRRRLAGWLQRAADWLDPVPPPVWALLTCWSCGGAIHPGETHTCPNGVSITYTSTTNTVGGTDETIGATVLVHGSRQAKPENMTTVEGPKR